MTSHERHRRVVRKRKKLRKKLAQAQEAERMLSKSDVLDTYTWTNAAVFGQMMVPNITTIIRIKGEP